MRQQTFVREREELGAYFGGLGPTIGLRASALERGGSGVFDESASKRLHLAHLMPQHRDALKQIDLVECVLRRVPWVVGLFRDVFTPIGAGRASWRLHTAFSVDGQTLLGLVVRSDAAVRLYWDRLKVKREDREFIPDPQPSVMLPFLEREMEKLRGNQIPTNHPLHAPLQEADVRYMRGLEEYHGHREQLRRPEPTHAEGQQTREQLIAQIELAFSEADDT